MLKHLYIDNYKTLVNFEMELDSIHLLLGGNGTGKSTVFEVLRKLRDFLAGEKITSLFSADDLTRWQSSPVQTFELQIAGEHGLYRYQLAIEHETNPANLSREARARVKTERLSLNDQPLLEFEMGEAQLYRDDNSKGPKYPFDSTQSAVGSLPERRDTTLHTTFKEEVRKWVIVQIIPNSQSMGEVSAEEYVLPTAYLEHFVSWYRYLSLDQGWVHHLTDELASILPGFDSFSFDRLGHDGRLLKANFIGEDGQRIAYRFSELSDGQRTLIALYTLLYLPDHPDFRDGILLCIDEPENFVALPEIQPWVAELSDRCQAHKIQALLISHHPEMINYLLASPIGYWFERDANSPVRIQPIQPEEDGLPMSELVARGWLANG